MFGGHGLTHDGKFFGIVFKGRVYFKVSDDTKKDYAEAGSEVFTPAKGRNLTSFYEVPADIVEAPKRMVEWARDAVRAAAAAQEDEGPQGGRIIRHPRS